MFGDFLLMLIKLRVEESLRGFMIGDGRCARRFDSFNLITET